MITWTSVAGEAHVIKRLHVGEVYTLREEFAPYGYLQAEEIQFTISDTEDVQYVEMQDEVPTGTIVINKDGEFLTDINLIKGHWYDFVFDYFKKSLAGVTFEVYAAEDSLIQGLYSSMTTDAVYASSFFRLHTSKQTQPIVDDIYYLVETKLPNEANILPMPSTIDEALKMKNSPEMKSFRHVMSEWRYYYSTNEFGLAEKIQKDIVKANKQFERLERFKRFASSPYTQLVCLAGGCLPNPAIAYPIAFTGYIAPLIANAAQQKHIWAITTNRNLRK